MRFVAAGFWGLVAVTELAAQVDYSRAERLLPWNTSRLV